MTYILAIVMVAIIHKRCSFVQACVLMGYIDGKSYCWLAKRILFVISFSLAGTTNMNVMSLW